MTKHMTDRIQFASIQAERGQVKTSRPVVAPLTVAQRAEMAAAFEVLVAKAPRTSVQPAGTERISFKSI